MTQEQKAQAYDEVREKIALRFGSNVAEEVFSEFEMSEDEKVRKEFCKDIWTFIPNEKAHKYIAWLEKQGEQKPVEWSEEDEAKRNALIGLVEEIKNQPLRRFEDWDGYISWLKSLRSQNNITEKELAQAKKECL